MVELGIVSSTNDVAREMLRKNPEEGTCLYSRFQENGRGQRGTTWESEPGKNVLMSLILFPKFLSIEEQFLLSKVVSLGVLDTLNEIIPGSSIKIKWPNDILVNGKKVCGILIENAIQSGRIESSIIGIGLNVNQEDFTGSFSFPPVSLKLITGNNFDIESLVGQLRSKILSWYSFLRSGNSKVIDRAYFSNLFLLGEVFEYADNLESVMKGSISEILPSGAIVILGEDGEKREYLFKEIRFIPR